MTAVLAGAAVALIGALAAASLGARAREEVLATLGDPLRRAPLGRRLGTGGPIVRWMEAAATRDGWPGPAAMYCVTLAASAISVAIAGDRLIGPVGAIAGFAGAPAALRELLRGRARRDQALAERQLNEFVEALAAAVRAGLSVRRSLAEAAREIASPLRPALDSAARALAVGEPLEEAFDRLAVVAGPRDTRLLSAVLALHARTGGDLPRLLDDVAAIVRHRIEGRRSVRALTAQGRASGAVLAVLPVAFVTLLSWTSGDGLGAFYRTPLGIALLVGGLLCEVLGFLWIKRIVGAPVRA